MANDDSKGADKPKTTRKAPAKKAASAAPKSKATGTATVKKATTTRKAASPKTVTKPAPVEVSAPAPVETQGIEADKGITNDSNNTAVPEQQPFTQSSHQIPTEDKGGMKMTNETNSDKGFWVQIILGMAVVILIFMYIRSLADKPSTQAAAGSASQSAQVASSEPKKDPGAALTEVVARLSSSDTAPQADATEPAPVVEQSVVAAVEEAPAAAVVEEAAVAVVEEPAPAAEPAADEVAVVAVTEAVVEVPAVAADAGAAVAEETTATASATTEEAQASAEQPAQEVADAKDAGVAEGGSAEQNKGRDWLSKLGFGKSEEGAATQEAAAADAAEAKVAEQDATEAVAQAPAQDAAPAAENQSVQAPVQPGFDPYVVAAPMMDAVSPQAGDDVPAWAQERMERVEKLRSELQESMAQMHEQARAKAMEERQRRYEERLQAMPEWMRTHVEKIDQLRKDLRDESIALQKAMREHRETRMAEPVPADAEAADVDDGDQGPEAAPAASYYPQVMPPHYGPRGYAYPNYPYRY
jgi:hypothetical protein